MPNICVCSVIAGCAVVVETGVKVFRIIDINDQTEDFNADVALTMRWRDLTLVDSTPALQEFTSCCS